MQHNYIKNKTSKLNNNYYNHEASNFIQLAKLIEKTGLIDIFDINPGEDLQKNNHSRKKAAELLGFLEEAIHNNFNEPNDFTRWNKLVQRYLSQ